MEIIIITWIGTIIASFGMEMANELRMLKDAADNGYRVDIKRMSELSKQMNPEAKEAALKSLLIIGLNIYGVFQRMLQYNNIRPFILDQLNVMDSLIPMTNEEKEQYMKRPTAINAFVINAMSQIASETVSSTINDGENKIVEIEPDIYIDSIIKNDKELGKNNDKLHKIHTEKLTLQEAKEELLKSKSEEKKKEEAPNLGGRSLKKKQKN